MDNLVKIMSIKEQYNYFNKDYTLINKLFSGFFEIITKCKHCGYESFKFEPFQTLSIQIPDLPRNSTKKINIYDCFRNFFKEEEVDEYVECNCCKFRTKVTRQFSINKFPKVLVIQLKRFKIINNYGQQRKIQTNVDYPENNLDMDEFTSEYLHQKFLDNLEKPEYNLYAVNIHSGQINFGHYVSLIKNNYDQIWRCYNDDNINEIDSIKSNNAYLLFYWRKN